jgi:hypothetical protein
MRPQIQRQGGESVIHQEMQEPDPLVAERKRPWDVVGSPKDSGEAAVVQRGRGSRGANRGVKKQNRNRTQGRNPDDPETRDEERKHRPASWYHWEDR